MKKTIKFGTSMSIETFDKLEKARKELKYKKSQIIEMALEKLFKVWKIRWIRSNKELKWLKLKQNIE